MDNEYISVKEFAAAAGVSPQYIYKKLNNQLKESLKVENGKKLININALSLFKNNQLNNQLTTS